MLIREGPLCHGSDNTAGWLNDNRRISGSMSMLKAVIGSVHKLFDIYNARGSKYLQHFKGLFII